MNEIHSSMYVAHRFRSITRLLLVGPALLECLACSTNLEDHPSGAPKALIQSAQGVTAQRSAQPSADAPLATSSQAPAVASAPAFSYEEARKLVFPDGLPGDVRCPDANRETGIHCLLSAGFAGDSQGAAMAKDLFDRFGSIAGVEEGHVMDGGFRGTIQLVPERPSGRFQKHLSWVLAAEKDHNRFMERLARSASRELRYRVSPVGYKFLRSVGRSTPSAYAHDWRVGYNVSGSLHSSAEAVRDTLFHEVFHLNDQAHEDWSRRVLGKDYDAIVARCGTKVSCLAPFAPGTTMVRGGTYYAFQPNNGDGVHEYGAELATRYFRETLAVLDQKPLREPSFKCGPPPNAQSFQALADEFFGGVDLIPPCR